MTKSKKGGLSKAADRFNVSRRVTERIIDELLEDLNTPRSLAVWMLYTYGEHDQLVELKVDPLDYCDPLQFRVDYLATELLSKADFLQLGRDPKQVAIDGHFSNEERCKVYNGYFRNLSCHPNYTGDNVWLYNAFTRKIRTVLGRCPEYEEVFDNCSWGPGATTVVKGVDTSHSNKFQHDAGITKDLLHTVSGEFMKCFPAWFIHIAVENDFTLFHGNAVTTVPATYRCVIKRSIRNGPKRRCLMIVRPSTSRVLLPFYQGRWCVRAYRETGLTSLMCLVADMDL